MMKEQFIFETEPFRVDSEAQGMSRSGRWFSQGRTIVVLPDSKLLPKGGEVYELSGGNIPSRKDLIDPRIDFHAQEALYRMLNRGNLASVEDARRMVEAIRTGRLGGIYIVNQLVPAQRARRLNTWWWLVIPKGEDAVAMSDPVGPPIIAFRDEIKSFVDRLGRALGEAFRRLFPEPTFNCRTVPSVVFRKDPCRYFDQCPSPNVVPGFVVACTARRAGFTGTALITAIAVAKAESGWDRCCVSATNDVGLWQINCANWNRFGGLAALFNIQNNANAAFALSSGGRNFSPWVAFKNGSFQKFIPEARGLASAVAAFDWCVPDVATSGV